MKLSEQQKKFLRGLGHKLNPSIMIGDKGLSKSVQAEFDSTLEHHELIKVKVRVGDRSARDAIIATLCAEHDAQLVQRIGNVALMYRPNPERQSVRLPAR